MDQSLIKRKKSTVAKYAKKILRFLERKKDKISPLLILTHDHPDPDALASAFALYHIAKNIYGIPSEIVYDGIIGRTENKEMVRNLKIPLSKLKPGHLKRYKNVALVDTQPAFENNPFPKKRKATIVLDQHSSVEKPLSQLTIIDTEIGATSVILAEAMLLLKVPIPAPLATALVYGILSDTMYLYRSSSKEIIKIYLSILPFSDLVALSQIINPVRSRSFFTTLGKGIENAMVKNRLIVSHLGVVETPDLVSQIADYLISYQRIQWCLCTGRHRKQLYVSLRLDQTCANAGEILCAQMFNQ